LGGPLGFGLEGWLFQLFEAFFGFGLALDEGGQVLQQVTDGLFSGQYY